jgi:hypothetical protein
MVPGLRARAGSCRLRCRFVSSVPPRRVCARQNLSRDLLTCKLSREAKVPLLYGDGEDLPERFSSSGTRALGAAHNRWGGGRYQTSGTRQLRSDDAGPDFMRMVRVLPQADRYCRLFHPSDRNRKRKADSYPVNIKCYPRNERHAPAHHRCRRPPVTARFPHSGKRTLSRVWRQSKLRLEPASDDFEAER